MRASKIVLGGAFLILGAAIGARALAYQAPPAPAASQVPTMVIAVAACRACHGEGGISQNPRVPNLAGQQQDYMVAQLRAFKAGTRKSELMESIAAQLGDDEMIAYANYYSGRPAVGGDAHAAAPAPSGPAIPSRMAFPAGFPTGFTLYKTIHGDGGAISERYANDVAFRAASDRRPLPDGSIIVVVNRPAPGAAPAGFAAMESRAGWGAALPALLRAGNWDFATFDAAKARNDRLNQAACLACHRAQAANSHVFTLADLREPGAQP